MTKNGITQFQIKELNSDVQSLKNDMKLVLENHLPHLKENILQLDTKIGELSTKITLFTAINIGGIVLGVIATRFLK